MGDPVVPFPVKLFTGVLSSDDARLQEVRDALETRLGPIDYCSECFSWNLTDYYTREMGGPINRYFWSFRDLMDPARLVDVKLFSNALEQTFAVNNFRRINLDPGYLDFHKMVLASVKDRAQKIYLSHGIYADPTLYYLKGKFHHYDWSLPDFKDDTYHGVFHKIREIYREAMKAGNFEIKFTGF